VAESGRHAEPEKQSEQINLHGVNVRKFNAFLIGGEFVPVANVEIESPHTAD
jgi:hypothetical protein